MLEPTLKEKDKNTIMDDLFRIIKNPRVERSPISDIIPSEAWELAERVDQAIKLRELINTRRDYNTEEPFQWTDWR